MPLDQDNSHQLAAIDFSESCSKLDPSKRAMCPHNRGTEAPNRQAPSLANQRMLLSVRSGVAEPRKHHQINVATGRVAPFAEFSRQGLVLLGESLGFKILEALMHKIEGVIDQLGGLFGRHDAAGEGELDRSWRCCKPGDRAGL